MKLQFAEGDLGGHFQGGGFEWGLLLEAIEAGGKRGTKQDEKAKGELYRGRGEGGALQGKSKDEEREEGKEVKSRESGARKGAKSMVEEARRKEDYREGRKATVRTD